MRTLGLIGGMSWESTLPYYRILNERVRERLGGLHSAKLLLYSVASQKSSSCNGPATGSAPVRSSPMLRRGCSRRGLRGC